MISSELIMGAAGVLIGIASRLITFGGTRVSRQEFDEFKKESYTNFARKDAMDRLTKDIDDLRAEVRQGFAQILSLFCGITGQQHPGIILRRTDTEH